MTRLIRDERGITLPEVLVAMIISTIVFVITLQVFEAANRQRVRTDKHTDAQQIVRVSLDRLARELRNLASPTDLTSSSSTLPRSIDRNEAYDLIFRSVRDTATGSATDANVQRVRYCLDTTAPTSSTLWRMEQADASGAMPGATACPGSGWENPKRVGTNYVNAIDGQVRPLFTYVGDAGVITATDDNSRADISRIHVDAYVDPTPGALPLETKLSTGLLLRNQNREPRARFTVTVTNFSSRTVQLNGSSSEDPEGYYLTYKWYDNDVYIGDGIVRDYTAPTTGTHRFTLKVYDPAGLEGVSDPFDVNF